MSSRSELLFHEKITVDAEHNQRTANIEHDKSTFGK